MNWFGCERAWSRNWLCNQQLRLLSLNDHAWDLRVHLLLLLGYHGGISTQHYRLCGHHILCLDSPILGVVVHGLLSVIHHHASGELHHPVLVGAHLFDDYARNDYHCYHYE
jgi:hypothetical protein